MSNLGNYEKTFKIIVIGDSNVGKTTLTYRFCEGTFLHPVEATIGVDFRSRKVELNQEPVMLWDTAGQERFRNSMVSHYYRNTHAVILVYDVTNAASFNNLKKWLDECNKHCLHDIPKILVGNKCDGAMAVQTNVAQKFADQHNMPLFETSARLDSEYDNVESIFLTLAHKLQSRKMFLPARNISVDAPADESKSGWHCC